MYNFLEGEVAMKTWHKDLCEYCHFKTNKNWARLISNKENTNNTLYISSSVDIENGILPITRWANHKKDQNILSIIEKAIDQELKNNDDMYLIKQCQNCYKISFYDPINNKIIHPYIEYNMNPNEDLSDDIKDLLIEASHIVNSSPRAAMALLRLALDKMINNLLSDEDQSKNLKKKINIVFTKYNISEKIKDIAHSIRGIGNESVHPGTIMDNVDREEVLFVFDMINLIAEETLTLSKKTDLFIEKYKNR